MRAAARAWGLRGQGHWERRRAPAVAELVRRRAGSGGVALDLGCGSGAVARELACRFTTMIGVDTAVDALRLARGRRRAPGLLLVAGDAQSLPIRTASIDVLYSYAVLHHTALPSALDEVRRVLVPGGTAILADFVDRGRDPRRVVPHLLGALRAIPGYVRGYGLGSAMIIGAFRLTPAWLRHLRQDAFLTREEFACQYSKALPGVQFEHNDAYSVALWRSPGYGSIEGNEAR